MQLTDDYTHDIEGRFKWAQLVLMGLVTLLLGRLYYLQVMRGTEYRQFSLDYSIREVRIPALRGLIVDRNGKVLASDQPTLDLVLVPQYVQNWEKVRASLASLLKIPSEELDAAWERRKGKPAYQSFTLFSNLSLDIVSRIRVHKTPWYFAEDPYDLRGVEIEARAARRYTDGALAPQLLGYLRESEAGDMEGAAGIEASHDKVLQGTPGSRDRVVNAMGRVVDYPPLMARLTQTAPEPGATLQLTLDTRLQEAARRSLADRAGAVVAMDSNTGEILALVSSPAFDLAALNGAGSIATWQKLLSDPRRPLINRAVQGAYPPGSTYKIVTALAGLSEGVVTPDEKIVCRGGIEVGGRRFGCWNKGGHGEVSLVRAITESCDVYFYTVGNRLGLDRLAHYAHLLGLGAKTQSDIPNERSGLIPTAAWKHARFGQGETAGDVVSAAIGQGFDLLTPLQDALMVARIVSGGKKIVPHVVKKSPPPIGEGGSRSGMIFQVKNHQPDRVSSTPQTIFLRKTVRMSGGEGESSMLDPAILTLIRHGMEGVVNSPTGTARHLAVLNLKIAGKTGTAQTVGYESKVKKGDHAWFVGYAPYDNPKIVVAAIVEYAGHGGTAAAPIVGEVIKAYMTSSPHAGEGVPQAVPTGEEEVHHAPTR